MANGPSRDEVEAAEKAEQLFRDYCDRSGITYLYVEQSSYSKSSSLIREEAGRPDFLVMEPFKMPFFLDVKARQFITSKGEPTFFLSKPGYMSARLSVERDYRPLRRFQNLVGIPVWVAWFERVGRQVRPEKMYVAPVNVLRNFKGPSHWDWMQIPLDCCATVDLKGNRLITYDIAPKQIQKFADMLQDYVEKH